MGFNSLYINALVLLQKYRNIGDFGQNVAETILVLRVSATFGRFATDLQHFCNIFATFLND